MPETLRTLPDPEMRLRVFDMRGHLIRQWTFVAYGHQFEIDWDGRNDAGVVAPTGWYIFDIAIRNVPGWDHIRFKMLRIRGSVDTTYDWSSH
jgi:hypothetical protein